MRIGAAVWLALLLGLASCQVGVPAREGRCAAGQIRCGERCVAPMTDRAHCGAKGDCEGANAGSACASGELCDGAGKCAVACQEALTECFGTCIDLSRDAEHCGACGTPCEQGLTCVMGSCSLICPEGRLRCGDSCIDPLTDRAHCGASGDCLAGNGGAACGPGELCDGTGACAATCSAGFTDCSGVCADLLGDPDHCGTCGDACAPGESCAQGQCCPAGYIACDGACVDSRTDREHCGSCGNACGAIEACVEGACRCPGWAPTRCDQTCVDALSDNANCGGCGQLCPSDDCFGGTCGGEPTFRVSAYTDNACVIYPNSHQHVSGWEQGGIAVSGGAALYSGQRATMRWTVARDTLEAWRGHPSALFSDLRSGQLYALTQGGAPYINCSQPIDGLQALESETGLPQSAVVPLSAPVAISCGDTGLFSGLGRLLLHDGQDPPRFWSVSLPDGVVTELGETKRLDHSYCNTFAYWGVAEQFGGEIFADYVAWYGGRILRTSATTGETSTIANLSDLGSMCGFTIDPGAGRWYWHVGGPSALPAAGEMTIGYCEAAWCGEAGCRCPTTLPDTCDGSCVSLSSDPGHCGACGAACPTGAVCEAGQCVCPRERPTFCGDACVNLASDRDHCGSCGTACPLHGVCSEGACSCPRFRPELCADTCVDRRSDARNCGECGHQCIDPSASYCGGGVCTSLASFSGIRTGVDAAELPGWSECFAESYSGYGTPLEEVLDACPGRLLMLACRRTGATTLDVAAYAAREDVTFDTGHAAASTSHVANGVAWYFHESWSWGFAPLGEPLEKWSCDTQPSLGEQRLCWHTSNDTLTDGYRCGQDTYSPGLERVILTAD